MKKKTFSAITQRISNEISSRYFTSFLSHQGIIIAICTAVIEATVYLEHDRLFPCSDLPYSKIGYALKTRNPEEAWLFKPSLNVNVRFNFMRNIIIKYIIKFLCRNSMWSTTVSNTIACCLLHLLLYYSVYRTIEHYSISSRFFSRKNPSAFSSDKITCL